MISELVKNQSKLFWVLHLGGCPSFSDELRRFDLAPVPRKDVKAWRWLPKETQQ